VYVINVVPVQKNRLCRFYLRGGGQFLFGPYYSCGTIIKRWILSKCILECVNDYAWL